MAPPTCEQLTLLFASAVALAASGCGPCRYGGAEWEKVVIVDAEELEGTFDAAHCTQLCGDEHGVGGTTECLETIEEGEPAVVCIYELFQDCGGIGRVPAGLQPPGAAHERPAPNGEVGQFFARVAHLEAASVFAFLQLGRELKAHGAPTELMGAARAAARDEARHALMMRRLARRFGARAAYARVTPPQVRSLERVARENAVEGCVRETWGAAIATWQAEHAEDAEVREVMQCIATDETRHAALAWAVHAWAARQLPKGVVANIERQAREGASTLHGEALAPELERLAGFPTAATQRRITATLSRALWGVAA